jgi:hypothetical protein
MCNEVRGSSVNSASSFALCLNSPHLLLRWYLQSNKIPSKDFPSLEESCASCWYVDARISQAFLALVGVMVNLGSSDVFDLHISRWHFASAHKQQTLVHTIARLLNDLAIQESYGTFACGRRLWASRC